MDSVWNLIEDMLEMLEAFHSDSGLEEDQIRINQFKLRRDTFKSFED